MNSSTQNIDWDAMRDFLAVADTGSFSKAADRLRVSQPTLSRRVATLEEQIGAKLFVRTSRGLLLTDDGEDVLEGARRVESEMLAIARKADAAQQRLSGTVRVSLSEVLGSQWLPSRLASFHAAQPGLCIELVVDNRTLDLVRREADIALRLFRPDQPDLVARKLGEVAIGMYASRDYLAGHGVPASAHSLKDHLLVGFGEAMMGRNAAVQRLESMFRRENIIHRSTSNTGQLNAIRAGIGVGVHDCFVADECSDLVRILPDTINHLMEAWLVTHNDIRRSARIRAVLDFIAAEFTKDQDRLSGRVRT